MNLLKMDVQEGLVKMTQKAYKEVADEAYNLIKTLSELDNQFYAEGRKPLIEFSEDEDYNLLDEIEIAFGNLVFGKLSVFAECVSSRNDSTHRRAVGSVYYLELLREQMQINTREYNPLDESVKALYRDLLRQALADLVFFSFNQFQLAETQASVEANEEICVDFALAQVLDENSVDPLDYLKEIKELIVRYRPTLSIFEMVPGSEELFYEEAGAYIQDFETLADLITVDHVAGVISGDLDAETLVKELERKNA